MNLRPLFFRAALVAGLLGCALLAADAVSQIDSPAAAVLDLSAGRWPLLGPWVVLPVFHLLAER